MQNYLFIPPSNVLYSSNGELSAAAKPPPPKICRNMIVKNEANVIERLLRSVISIIDTFCICDTGSNDNTMMIIRRFFKEHGIPGKLIEEPFRDFAYNRNWALKQARELIKDTDFFLLIDADMVLESNISASILKQSLLYGRSQPDTTANLYQQRFETAPLRGARSNLSVELPIENSNSVPFEVFNGLKDAYYVLQGTDTFQYKNIRLLKNNPMFSYSGVTHEYIQLLPDSQTDIIDSDILFIRDIGDGGSKEDKFKRDIRLLEKGLKENPKNERYTFYLANSYRDSGKFQKAIDYYLKRIEMGGWVEEVWFSYYSIGKCFQKMEQMSDAIYYWLEGFHYYPKRLENIYQIVKYYREQSKYTSAYAFYSMARNNGGGEAATKDHLFYEKDIYEYKLDYEFSIIAYYCNWYNYDILATCQKVLSANILPDSIRKNILQNYKFYVPAVEEWADESNQLTLLEIAGEPSLKLDEDFIESTPSIVFNKNTQTLIMTIRYVNYRLSPTCGGYKLKDNIVSKNRILRFSYSPEERTFQKIDEFWLKYDTSQDAYYCGIEDIRLLIDDEGNVKCNGNRVLRTGEIVIEHGIIDWNTQYAITDCVRKKTEQRKIEKNWVMFGGEAAVKVVYEWYPFTIGRYERSVTTGELLFDIISVEKNTPSVLKGVRGSTNGIILGDEIWFLCHVVSYEDKSYYYHLFVVLDTKSNQIKQVSKYFTFGKKRVEYTLGFVYFEDTDTFFIGYSQMDCETRFLSLSRTDIERLF